MGKDKIWCPRIHTVKTRDHHAEIHQGAHTLTEQISTLFVRADDGPLSTTEMDMPVDDVSVCRGRAVVYREGRSVLLAYVVVARFDQQMCVVVVASQLSGGGDVS
jgi:GH43 family beta-xylosidase